MVLALKRSGHHGVLNWLCQQTNGDSLYWDQCQSKRAERKLFPTYAAIYYDGVGGRLTRYQKDFRKIKYQAVRNCFISIESFGYARDDRISSLKDVVGIKNITPSHVIIINRDFYNWMASCFVIGGKIYKHRRTMTRMWKAFVRESLDPNVLKDYQVVDINYNQWFGSTDYRRKVCARLGLTFTDRGLNDMLRSSTFDVWKHQGHAQKMNVLDRYKRCLGDKDYMNLVDDEVLELSEAYFGFVPKEMRR